MNSARVPYFELQIRLMWPNLLEAERIRVLDVGCGGGIVSEALAKKGAHSHASACLRRIPLTVCQGSR